MSEHIKQLVIRTTGRTLDQTLDPNTLILEVSYECKKNMWI